MILKRIIKVVFIVTVICIISTILIFIGNCQ